MPTYTLDELLKLMEPQTKRDKALINKCIDGLGIYAAEQTASGFETEKTDKIRSLVETLVYYWGLDNDENNANAPQIDGYLRIFDERIEAAKSGEAIPGDNPFYHTDMLFGLYRYGEDMVGSQGDDAMEEILSICKLMSEVVSGWEDDSLMVCELTARLENEVKQMLSQITLPGQEQSGELVHGYEIKQAVLFDNNRGFALAENLDAASPFVTWQFTEEEGKPRDYYWGRYQSSENNACADYIFRIRDYMQCNNVKEKPVFTNSADLKSDKKPSVIEQIKSTKNTLSDSQTIAKRKKTQEPEI